VGNAIKYMGGAGNIAVSHEVTADGHVVTHIADTGLGISKEAQEKLFQKFYRVQTDKTKEITGTGLGLFIVKEIVEKMNGTIWATSEEGKGSVFSFSLPLPRRTINLMIIKNATQIGNPVIRAKAKPVKLATSPRTKKIVRDLIDSMRYHGLVGMAAPQIGISLRVFVTELRETNVRRAKDADVVRVFINPKSSTARKSSALTARDAAVWRAPVCSAWSRGHRASS